MSTIMQKIKEIEDEVIGDSALQKKHHDMLQRLSARHQARISGSPPDSASSSTLESTSSFLARFADSKRSIESRIVESRLAESSAKLKSDLSLAIENLEKLLAENSYFLPSYELRSSLKAVSHLKQSLDSLSGPKKKFSFKTKSSSSTKLCETSPKKQFFYRKQVSMY